MFKTKVLLSILIILFIRFHLVSAGVIDTNNVKLIIRGDGFGLTSGSLYAFRKAFSEGVLTSATIDVHGEYFKYAIQLCRKNPKWCIGLNLAITGQWRNSRWKPALPPHLVPSIVDNKGYLFENPELLFFTKPNLNEINGELRAQIDLVLNKEITLDFIDLPATNINNNTYPELKEILTKISNDYHIPLASQFGIQHFSIFSEKNEQKMIKLTNILENLKSGLWEWQCYPDYDHLKQILFFTRGPLTPGETEFNILTNPTIQSLIIQKNIFLINYKELSPFKPLK